ncbi:MAG: HEAT repeat domain-containing protein [Isosphaerales bacterium]
MSEVRPLEPEHRASQAEAGPKKARRFQTGVRTLIVLVACCGLLLWAGRYLWESQHPAVAAVRGLQAPKASERINAIRDLKSVDQQESMLAIPPLLARLGDTDAEVRAAAADALGLLGGNAVKTDSSGNKVRAAVSALLASLDDPETAVRIAAADALGQIAGSDPAGVIDLKPPHAAFMEMLGDRDDQVRGAAIRALGVVGPRISDDPPPALIAALEDESAGNRAAAVDALVNFTGGLHRSMPSLLRFLEKARPEVRKDYVRLLGCIKPPTFSAEVVPAFITALGSRHREVRYLAASRLASFKNDAKAAIPALIKVLREPIDPDSHGPGKETEPLDSREPSLAAAGTLSGLAPGTEWSREVVAALVEILRSGGREQRRSAALALHEFGPEAVVAIPALIAALRETAATDKPVPPIMPNTHLGGQGPDRGEVSQDAGQSIAYALREIAENTTSAGEVAMALTEALASRSSYTRDAAKSLLVRLGPKAVGATPRLRALQKDPDPNVREAATSVLERLDNPP